MKNTFLTLTFFISLAITAETYTVKMLNQGAEGIMVFEPSILDVDVGDTVIFEATDAAHNSESMEGMIPNGAVSWSGPLSKDISVTFDIPGVYGYQCTPHSMMAMVGIIRVGKNIDNLESLKAVANIKKSSFVMNQGRLDSYIDNL
jgi:pseudoazurin